MNAQDAHKLCTDHMGRFVRIHMHDGVVFDGVIEHVDEVHVYIVCPAAEEQRVSEGEDRYFPYPGYGPGYFYGPGYPYSYFYPRPRRYGLPLAGLLGLSLLPFVW